MRARASRLTPLRQSDFRDHALGLQQPCLPPAALSRSSRKAIARLALQDRPQDTCGSGQAGRRRSIAARGSRNRDAGLAASRRKRKRPHRRAGAVCSLVRARPRSSMAFAAAFGFLTGDGRPAMALRSACLRHRLRRAVRGRLRLHRCSCRACGRRCAANCGSCGIRTEDCATATGSSRRPRSAPAASSKRRATSSCAATAPAASPTQRRLLHARRRGRAELCRAAPSICRCSSRATPRCAARRHAHPRPEDRDAGRARAGSPGAKSSVRTGDGIRSAERRPRRHRPRRGRARAVRRARPGGSREPRQVALPRDGLARDPHAAQRHPRHGRICCSTRRSRPSRRPTPRR